MKKFAIITGASQGIGKAIAIKLAELGYDLALIARNINKLQEIKSIISSQYSNRVEVVPLDITDISNVEDTLPRLISQCKTPDILINCAGIVKRGTSEMAVEDLEKILKVNVIGMHHIIKICAPKMKEQKSGHIINIASTSGRLALASFGAYAASKFGVVGYSEALYKELAPYHIKVTTINPGMVNTEMTDSAPMENSDKIQPEDIAETVAYLLKLSDKAIVKEVVLQCESRVAVA